MAANTISYAQLFQQIADEQMIQELTSGWMELSSEQIIYRGGNTIQIPDISLTGLGDYSRSTGYPTSGSVTFAWTPHTFEKDRAQRFALDRNDVDETNFVATASMVIGEFQRTKVAPEVDAYRYSKIFSTANAALKTSNYIPVTATVFQQLKNDISLIQDVIGETEPLVVMMSIPAANVLDQADKISHELSETEIQTGDRKTKYRSLDGIPIIRVASTRFKSEYTFSATDGFSPTATAMNMNWIICAKRAVTGISKTDVIKIFMPEQNILADGYDIQYRKYHTLIVPKNKVASIWVSYYSTPAPALTATVAQGSSTGTTKFTATAGVGNSLKYTLTATAADGFYNTIPTATAYTTGANITATAGQYLGMYEVTSAGRIVKFASKLLVSGDIAP